MLYFLLTILLVSQVVSFYLIFNKIKPIIRPKPQGIFLKEIPNKPTYEDLDKDHKLVYDIMESVKLEKWKLEITPDISYSSSSWEVNFESQTGIRIRSRLRKREGGTSPGLYLSSFRVYVDKGSVFIDDGSKIENDVISFLWDYVVKYHENENEEIRIYYQDTIDDISSKLKTLKRSERLNNILGL